MIVICITFYFYIVTQDTIMKSLIFIIIAFLTCLSAIKLDTTNLAKKESYCFSFAWLPSHVGPINCSDPIYKRIPCFEEEKTLTTNEPLNYQNIWKNRTNNKYICALQPGQICLKHTFYYTNIEKSITHFCGKMVEKIKGKNLEKPVDSGCYSQKNGTETLKACACRSPGSDDKIPCNSSLRNFPQVIFTILLPVVLYISLT